METAISWITGIIAAASVLANLTASSKDNEFLAKAGQVYSTACPEPAQIDEYKKQKVEGRDDNVSAFSYY